MSQKTSNVHFSLKEFFTRFPAFPYILKWLALSSIIGVLVGSVSAGFLQSLNWVTDYREQHIWLIAFLPLAGLGIGFLYLYGGKEIELGNNLLIDTIHEPKKKIPFLMAPFVYIGTIVTHLFGGSAGREGTALQMAGAIADQFTRPFKLTPSDRKILLIAAIAAGFGSVFGTPLAGAVFGLEVFLIGRIRYNAIFPAFAASILADLVTKAWGTPHTHYHIDSIPAIATLPIIYSILAGVVFGLCAATFSKSLHFLTKWFKEWMPFTPLRTFSGGILIALALFFIGTTKYIGLGIPTMVESFQQQLPAYDFALKMAFTLLTLAVGFKGGEVTPLFFIGATLGNALSYIIPLPTALLAGMGFVAVFAGATNTPLACIIMAVELFGVDSGVYVAIACIVAYLLSGHNSIYSQQRIGEAKHTHFSSLQNKAMKEVRK